MSTKQRILTNTGTSSSRSLKLFFLMGAIVLCFYVAGVMATMARMAGVYQEPVFDFPASDIWSNIWEGTIRLDVAPPILIIIGVLLVFQFARLYNRT